MSPTSILDTKSFSGLRNPFRSDSPKTPTEPSKLHWKALDSRHVGLGIVDSFADEKSDPSKTTRPETRAVLFGSQLKIQIPSLPPPSPTDPSFKERNPEVGSFSSSLLRSPSVRKLGSDSNRVFAGCLSASEMELSEDYTCVIAHGPNPRTTRIFEDCIIESYSGVGSFSAKKKMHGYMGYLGERCSFPSESFLSFCHSCKNNIGQGKDIYMYRGEKAFCSQECRYREMLLEEETEKLASEDSLAYP